MREVKKNKCLLRLTSAVLLISGLGSASNLYADAWSYHLEPYVMATNIEGDAGLGRVNGADVDVDMDAILEVLDIGAMIHFEALHESGWGFVVDYSFMDLREDISRPRGGVVDARVRQGVLELQGLYRRQLDSATLDYLFGIRWWDNDLEVGVDPAILPGSIDAERDVDWIDAFVGLRWIQRLDDNWQFFARGDVGGAGLEADFTSSVSTGFHYRMSDSMVLNLHYRGTWVDYTEGSRGERDYFNYDTVTHGPIVGLIFQF